MTEPKMYFYHRRDCRRSQGRMKSKGFSPRQKWKRYIGPSARDKKRASYTTPVVLLVALVLVAAAMILVAVLTGC